MTERPHAHKPHEGPSDHADSTYCQMMFFRLAPEFRRTVSAADRKKAAADFAEFITAGGGVEGTEARAYSVAGYRGDCEMMLWVITKDMLNIHKFGEALSRRPLAAWLDTAHSFTAMTKRGPYGQPHEQNFEKFPPSTYTFVYPFIKSKEWYLLPREERMALMMEHIENGRKFPSVKLNTMYAFGLDDFDFLLAFETESPSDFSDLVQKLRESKVSRYTVKDNPMLICVRKTPWELMEGLGLA
jgi:chlorite dismutase